MAIWHAASGSAWLRGCGWAIGFALAYLRVVEVQGNEPVWWYAAILATGATSACAGAAKSGRALTVLALGLLLVAELLAAPSIGLALTPAFVCLGVALADPRPSHDGGLSPR